MATRSDGLNASSENECIFECGKINNNTLIINYMDVLTEEIAYTMNVYMTPVLVILGIIGNLLSVIVFFKVNLQGQSTSQYLSALAISDTVFLLQLIPAWLKAVKASIVFAQNGFCQIFAYATYVSSSLSSWLVVSFTVERFVAVLYPLRRTRLCTLRRARILILMITACCLAINIPVLIFVVPSGNDCNIDDDLMDHAARFNMVDTIFAFSLPLAVIIVLNVLIMIGVCRQGRARDRLLSQEAKLQGERASLARRSRPKRSLQQRITRILLIVSSVFVILNLPAYTMRIVAYASNMSSHEYTGRWAAIQQICLQFFNVNFGINFLLYCMTGQNFRRALCQTFPCLGHTWKIMNRLCCWRTEEHSSPARAATTRSYVTPKEARTAAEYEESLRVNMERELGWHMRGQGGRLRDESLEMHSFNNSRQRQQRVRFTLPLEPVHMYRFKSGILHRPVPRAPLERLASPPATSASTNVGPSTSYAMSAFQPIPNHLIPGQIAPLSANSPTPTPNLDISPSPNALSAWQEGCDGLGRFIHTDDRDSPTLTPGLNPSPSPSPNALSAWQEGCDGHPDDSDSPTLTPGLDPSPSPSPNALSAWQEGCDDHPDNSDSPTLTPGLDASSSPSPDTFSPWLKGHEGFRIFIRPDDTVRMCPCKYVNFGNMRSEILTPKKRVSFMPVHGPMPMGYLPAAPARTRAPSQPQLVRTRSLSPMVCSPRRCATAPASLCQRASDTTRQGDERAVRPAKLRKHMPESCCI